MTHQMSMCVWIAVSTFRTDGVTRNAARTVRYFTTDNALITITGQIAKVNWSIRKDGNKPLRLSGYAKNGKKGTQIGFRYTVNARSKSTARRQVTTRKVEPVRTAMLIYLSGDTTPKSACLALHLLPGRAGFAMPTFRIKAPGHNSVTKSVGEAIGSQKSSRDTPRRVPNAMKPRSTLNSDGITVSDAQPVGIAKLRTRHNGSTTSLLSRRQEGISVNASLRK